MFYLEIVNAMNNLYPLLMNCKIVANPINCGRGLFTGTKPPYKHSKKMRIEDFRAVQESFLPPFSLSRFFKAEYNKKRKNKNINPIKVEYFLIYGDILLLLLFPIHCLAFSFLHNTHIA